MPELNIAIDAMGGDNGPSIVIEALERAVSTYPNTHFTVFGHKDQINPLLKQYNLNESTAVSLVHAEQTILMDDKPGQSLRSKPNSSMRLALQALANEQCHAMVCGGNTGALMTNAYFTVKTLHIICIRTHSKIIARKGPKHDKQSLRKHSSATF